MKSLEFLGAMCIVLGIAITARLEFYPAIVLIVLGCFFIFDRDKRK